ncbi:general substrate transporter [Aspergillus cavernicola]|uniref:General substrate transporter n=1 Tax=Aspergillus cavernicola TaxID=176166 RepID=A0ABR4IQK9_9EURO
MSSYAQLPQEVTDPDVPPHDRHPSQHARPLQIYWLSAIVCCGGLLFGYDSGVIGGVLTFDSFLRDFRYTTDEQTRVSSIAVGIQQAGALVGCLLIWPLTNRYGRRRALMLCSAIFCFGVIFEIINSHSLPVFYIGRIICGLGVGGSATVSPIYLAEMSPKHLRARLGSGYQFTFTIGIFISYWIDYALQFRAPTQAQWQIPLALQLIPGALMGLGMLFLNESVRWLLSHGHTTAAWKSLVWIRATQTNHSAVVAEFAEMKRAVDDDLDATANFHPRELLFRSNLHRIFLAVSLFIAQQATGATAMAYFGPQFFALLVGGGADSQSQKETHSLTLLLTGIFGALKVLSCLFFILFVADRFGRRPLLALGALGMSICMISTSILLLKSPPASSPSHSSTTTTTTTSLPATSTLTILLIYTSITLYNLSWGPLPWPLSAELFPTRTRSPGVSLAVASQWVSNFIWSFSTPYILENLKWATFLLFGVFDAGIAGFVVLCVPETRGLTLEEVQGLFEGDGREDDGREREGLVGGDCYDGHDHFTVSIY